MKDSDRRCSLIGPDQQETFKSWRIDLIAVNPPERLAVEGKYKLVSDVAVTDNRKEAFFDIFKLEQYVTSGKYSGGLFCGSLTNIAILNRRRVRRRISVFMTVGLTALALHLMPPVPAARACPSRWC